MLEGRRVQVAVHPVARPSVGASSSRLFFSLANAIPAGPSAMNSGLMPNGSRATNSTRSWASQIAKANMPRSREHRGRAPVVVGGDDRLGVALGGERRAQLRELGAQLAGSCRSRR